MSEWLRWTVPSVLVVSVASPAYAVQYLTVDEAQNVAFPGATQFLEAHVVFTPQQIAEIERRSGQKVQTRGEQIWKAKIGDQLLGYFILDYVIGKHSVIDYAVALDPDGRVKQVEILEYRESYGGEIKDSDWLAQFIGKTSRDSLEIDRDIRHISGATLSSRHVTEGIKRVLAVYNTVLR